MEFWTWTELFEDIAKKRSDTIAVACGKEKVTWREFDKKANQVANALLELGVKRKDKIMVSTFFDKSIEFMEIFYGTMKLATVPTYLNYRYVKDEIAYVINNAEAAFIFIQEDLLPKVLEVKDKLRNIKNLVVIGEKENTPNGMYNFKELLEGSSDKKPSFGWDPPKPEETAYFLYTTGTTGKPKAVIESHKDNIIEAAHSLSFVERLIALKYNDMSEQLNVKKKYVEKNTNPRYTSTVLTFYGFDTDVIPDLFGGERYLCIPPLITAAGIAHSLVMLGSGNTVYYPSGKSLNPAEILGTIQEEKITSMLLAGDVIALPLVNVLKNEKYDTSSLAKIFSTGMKFSKTLKKTLLDLIPNTVILDMLSTSEAWYHSGNISIPGEEIKDAFFPTTPLHTVILSEKGKLVKIGEIGELVTFKEKKTFGYYRDPEKTEKTFRVIQMPFQANKGLWIFTGDYGTYDHEGRIKLYGRAHEIITTGGLKVFAPEVAQVIIDHPNVLDVAVVGTPHERWGEAVTAIVKLKSGTSSTEKDIIDFCRGKIADFKIPKRVVFADVPRDPMGKIPIKIARKLAMDKLGLA